MEKSSYTNLSSYQYIQNSLSSESFEEFSERAYDNRKRSRDEAVQDNPSLVNQEEDYVKSDIKSRNSAFIDLDPESYADDNIKPSNWRK